VLAPRGLPGIRIDVAPPPPAEVLPRMDVAVFVGFAATGPAHRPVVIESVAQYSALFGPDAPLAWNVARGERVYANLGPAVRAFFSNGGRRCFVIRVTRTRALEAAWRGLPANAIAASDVAVANRFAMPGVLVLPAAGLPAAPALAQARSLGAWSDPLRLSTALVSASFTLTDCTTIAPQRIAFATGAALQAGDLVQFDDAPAGSATRLYATVDRVSSAGNSASRQVEAMLCAAFAALPLTSPPRR
jgi:hypothetical protein